MTATIERPPRILACGWGHVDVEGYGTLKDAKLYPGGARAWDWSETGTRHTPGIQPADVKELLDHGACVVVLSKGMWRMLQVCPETLALLRERGIRVHVLPTGESVTAYNLLREAEPAGALIHSTC